jgi:alkylation response protein AidB-like acyl-CoA dehydrogenase
MSLAVTTMVSVATGLTILRYGNEQQKQRYLPRLVSGEGLGAVAGTEPNAGSDTEGFTTTAREEAGSWVINGSKAFITNAGTKITDVICTLAVTGRKPNGRKQFGMLLVPAGTLGLVVAPGYRKMGWRSSDTHPLFFEDCRVSADAMLGERGRGRYFLHQAYAQARMCLSATSIGLGQACLDASVKYAQERTAFGRSIGHFQMIQDMVAEMAVQLEAARLLTYKAAWLVDQGTPSLQAAATAKYFGTEAGKKAADLAVQVHGGLGYMDECAVSRYYRDIRIATIGDGSSQIQKLIIARELGLGSGFGMG